MTGIIQPFDGMTPKIAAGAFVAETAVLIGDVEVGAGASIWYGCVLRADLTAADLETCLTLDRYPFAVRVTEQDGLLVARADSKSVHVSTKPDAPGQYGDAKRANS